MTAEDAKSLYAGKTFYVKESDGTLRQSDNIRFTTMKGRPSPEVAFVEVIDGKVVRGFRDDEIEVRTDAT